MKLASTLTLTAASVCCLAAIWRPFDTGWVQWLLTGVMLAVIGIAFAEKADRPDYEVRLHDLHELTPEELAAELGTDRAESHEKAPQSDEHPATAPREGHSDSERSEGHPREFGKKADQ